MKLWKVILLFFSVLAISFFIKWWMTYEPMELYVENEGNEGVNLTIVIIGMDGKEYFNSTFFLRVNESRTFSNITNLAGNYFVYVKAGDMHCRKKIKFGKYFERIEIFMGGGIAVKNEMT